MFRVIFGMAEDRQKIINTCRNYSELLANHIIKCIVYKNTTGDYNHWISEICNWIWRINEMKPKKGFKIEPNQYQDSLFIGIGTEVEDARRDIEIFKDFHVENGEYPDFNLTKELYTKVFKCFHELSSDVSKKLGNFQSKQEVKDAITKIITKYSGVCI